jgi:hypothetical protein
MILAREIDVHAGAGTEHEAVDARGNVALEVLLERAEIDMALGVEGGGDGEIEAGEEEIGHGRKLSALERSSVIVLI